MEEEPETHEPQFGSLGLKFKYPWRPEQQRVLNHLEHYHDDNRIHIVAAPGAGKTVIGLEIFNRYRLKTLAISPTRIVRNQWIERLLAFLPENSNAPDWCSTKLDSPQLFTAITYQGLFSFDKRIEEATDDDIDKEYESIVHWFKEHDIRLLILDEAHHLKAAWWKVLMKIVKQSEDLLIVSLTATPPYDSNATEWSRYQKLCGPVDEEISIPELVRSNSLCPHQDYIWMVKTDNKNITSLKRQQENLARFVESLNTNFELLYLLQLHDWLVPDAVIRQRDILYNLDECFALLGLLKHHQKPLPDHLLLLLDITEDDINPMSIFAWENLLQSFLEGKYYPSAAPVTEFRETLSRLLKGKYFLKYSKVSLDNSRKKLEAFNKTQERIKACFDIATVEYQARQEWSRIVVLADYIHDEKYQLALDGLEAPTGAYPIFHYYIHHLEDSLAAKTALLTGRLSIIHQDLLARLSEHFPSTLTIKSKPYSEDKNFVVLNISSEYVSAAFTKLHKKGDLIFLIGTRALLGEGWDAPHVNSLILATQTGAYVSSNQVRGRAIRINLEDDFKTASIWHIVAVSPLSEYNEFILKDLHRRFKTFAGIHADELRIESGIDRLAISNDSLSQQDEQIKLDIIKRSNKKTIKRHQDDIFNLQARWQNALEMVEKHVFQTGLQIRIGKEDAINTISQYVAQLEKSQIESLHKRLKTKSLLTTGVLASVAVASPFVMMNSFGITAMPSLLAASISPVLLALFFRDKSKKTNITSSINADYLPLAFAQVTLSALQDIGMIQTKDRPEENNIQISQIEKGYFRFSLNDFTRKEDDIFLTALSQLLEPIQQPRYLIALNNKPQSGDIFPVPHYLGNRKDNANAFLVAWKRVLPEFPDVQLFSTSSTLGREYLLKARAANYSEQESDNIRLIERWE
ncbi:MAG: DEAD/DEAH box helicase family protein [Cocleimonas sp.]|nr:DEAD/DEAH box helicase family protein [Cocleimonas sp.]